MFKVGDVVDLKRNWMRKSLYELEFLLPDNNKMMMMPWLDFVKYYNRQNNKMVPMDQFVPSTEWYQKEQNNNAVFFLFS